MDDESARLTDIADAIGAEPVAQQPEAPTLAENDLLSRLNYHGKYCLDQRGEQSRTMLEAAVRIRALTALLREHVPDSHYAHFDRQGTAGANCPACIARREWQKRVDAALATSDSAASTT